MQENIQFPKELESFFPVFEKLKKKFINITNTPQKDVQIWQSKFGGMPFLPVGVEYPKNAKGEPLYLLAQINFEEVPAIENFPQKGILQFYIADDDLYGMDFDKPSEQNGFRVLYFADIDKESFQRDLPLVKAELTPLGKNLETHQLTFEVAEEYVGLNDANLESALGDKLDEFNEIIEANEYKIADWLSNQVRNAGHKIGGYADFVQEDPRKYDEEKFKQYNTLLFQMDSEGSICWGDMGVGNFFIDIEKLKKLDFSDVLYNWDCG
ncbi:hypothetical protein AD998_09255 [bacterium 336/3]|nr:hypothetical protein AD998_09255 [bacterium 336/3]